MSRHRLPPGTVPERLNRPGGRGRPGLTAVLFALSLLCAALLVYLARRPSPGSSAAAPGGACPAGGRQDASRARRIAELLGRARAGRQLPDREGRLHSICFASAANSALVEGGAVLLDERASDSENAARLGHLLAHACALAALPDFNDASRSCDAIVDDALRAEARAYSLEVALRRQLGVVEPHRVLAFEDRSRGAAPGEDEERIRAYLTTHPDGDGHLPGLARGYRTRCEAAQGASRRNSGPEPNSHGRPNRRGEQSAEDD